MMKSPKKAKTHIPDDLVHQIILRSPATTLTRLKFVSKSWLSLITNPDFINLHHNRAVNDNKFSIVLYDKEYFYFFDPKAPTLSSALAYHENRGFSVKGSCNGLLLLVQNRSFLHIIWNPSTRDFVPIPSPSESLHNLLDETSRCECHWLYGFGYDSNTDGYKVVAIAQTFREVSVEIFSTSPQPWTWRRINQKSYSGLFDDLFFNDLQGKFANGAVHWLGSNYANWDTEWRLVAFDLSSEEFKEVPLPRNRKNDDEDVRLSVWENSMYLFIKKCRRYSSDIFVMKEYGRGDTWCKLYTVPESREMNPRGGMWRIVCFMDDGRILLEGDLNNLVLYDPKSKRFANFELNEIIRRAFVRGCSLHAYVPSLLPIKYN